ncbi:MAG: GNAT family N-acetyltransferase [Acidobacteriota bacterium]
MMARSVLMDVLHEPSWDRMVAVHPRATVFHSRGWLEALRRTYGYRAVALCSPSSNGDVVNAFVFGVVRSRLTGNRLVSLPFSDHCDPLVAEPWELYPLLEALPAAAPGLAGQKSRYTEFRPLTPGLDAVFADSDRWGPCAKFVFHELDLTGGSSRLFQGFHKDCVQRKIRRAEREAIVCHQVKGDAEDAALDDFYALLIRSRQRHGIPPQPRRWFLSLQECLGPACRIRVGYKAGRPVGAILTVTFRDRCVFKYGASSGEGNRMGVMQMLLWEAIREACEEGCSVFDFGRTDLDQEDLAVFKDRWGAKRIPLTYYSCPFPATVTEPTWHKVMSRIGPRLPLPVLELAGLPLARG